MVFGRFCSSQIQHNRIATTQEAEERRYWRLYSSPSWAMEYQGHHTTGAYASSPTYNFLR